MHAKAVFIGMAVGTVVASYMAFAGLKPFGIASGLWGLFINTILSVVLSFMMKQTEAERVRVEKAIS